MVTTIIACVLIVIQSLLDRHYRELDAGFDQETKENAATDSFLGLEQASLEGSIKAFASIMFAFAGASTFPTIQADMKHKGQFKISAIMACTSMYYE